MQRQGGTNVQVSLPAFSRATGGDLFSQVHFGSFGSGSAGASSGTLFGVALLALVVGGLAVRLWGGR